MSSYHPTRYTTNDDDDEIIDSRMSSTRNPSNITGTSTSTDADDGDDDEDLGRDRYQQPFEFSTTEETEYTEDDTTASATTDASSSMMYGSSIPALADSIETVETGSPQKSSILSAGGDDDDNDEDSEYDDRVLRNFDSMPSGAIPSVDSTTPESPQQQLASRQLQQQSSAPNATTVATTSAVPSSARARYQAPPANSRFAKNSATSRMGAEGADHRPAHNAASTYSYSPSPQGRADSHRNNDRTAPTSSPAATTATATNEADPIPVIATTRSGGEVVVSKRIGAAPPRPVTPNRNRPNGGTTTRSSSSGSSSTPPTTPRRSATSSQNMAASQPRQYNDAIRLSLVGHSPTSSKKDLPNTSPAAATTTMPITPMALRHDPDSMEMLMPTDNNTKLGREMQTQPTGANEAEKAASTKETDESNNKSEDVDEEEDEVVPPPPSLQPRVSSNRVRIIRSPAERAARESSGSGAAVPRPMNLNASDATANSSTVAANNNAQRARFGMSPEDWEAKQRAKYGPNYKSRNPALASPKNQTSNASEHTASTIQATNRPVAAHAARLTAVARRSNADEEMANAKRSARAERDNANRLATNSSESSGPFLLDEDETPKASSSRQQQLQHQNYKQGPSTPRQGNGHADNTNASRTPGSASRASTPRSSIVEPTPLPQQALENLNAGPQYLSDEDVDLDGEEDDEEQQQQQQQQQNDARSEKQRLANPSGDGRVPRIGPSRTHRSMRMAAELRESGQQDVQRSTSASMAASAAAASEKAGMRVSRGSYASRASHNSNRGSTMSRRIRREQQKFSNLQNTNTQVDDAPAVHDDDDETDYGYGTIQTGAHRGSVASSVVSDITMSDMGTVMGDDVAVGIGKSRMMSPPMSTVVDNYDSSHDSFDPETLRQSHNSNRADAYSNSGGATNTHDNSYSVAASVADSSHLSASVISSSQRESLGGSAQIEQAITAELVTAEPDEELERERIRKEAEREAEERMRNNLVVAEPAIIDDESEDDDGPGRKQLYICLAILVAVIGIVVAVVVTTTGGDDGNGGGDEIVAATLPPTARPFNDVCELAHELDSNGDVASTNNQNAENDDVECVVGNQGGTGVWYTLQGNGKRLRAHTCDGTDIDTQIQIFSGDCDALSCIGGNDQLCGDQSSIGWFAEADTTYKILVGGFRVSNVGPITLTLEGLDDNNQCSDAEEVSDTTIFNGSTRDVLNVVSLDACDAAEAVTTPSAWYRIQGDGKPRCASLVNQRDFLFESQMSIVSGSCDGLQCVAGIEGGESDEVLWSTDEGTDYYVVVHGTERSTEGDYRLTIKFPPENTVCPNAEVFNTTVQGNTGSACTEDISICSNARQTPGLWYTMTGTGGIIGISSCDTESSKIVISLSQGADCGTPTCITSNTFQKPCGNQASMHWKSELDETYIVFVQSTIQVVTADFTLNFDEPEISFDCAAPILLEESDEMLGYIDDDESSTYSFLGSDDNVTTSGSWFSFNGTGSSYLLSTCNDANKIATEVLLFTGECDQLELVESIQQPCEFGSIVSFDSVVGVDYTILVQERASTGGTGAVDDSDKIFSLSIENGRLGVANDLCQASTQLEYPADGIPTRILDSTTNATNEENITFCGLSNFIAAPVWYSIVGQGANLTASLCSDFTTFDTQIYIYSGGCDVLECVAADNDSCGERSVVTWLAEEGETFHILVGGHVGTGDFRLEVGEAV
mmetsp:Transcript_3164/g.8947  ORF Transcript_3164/g.8947 Transcript_3164/m.8947 type:complete len:1708 (+) Transcript_3164:604-5727(+)|eukprot:CAMPEP_0119555998 /NCGR_PEP_ID=MMETSP1352-20130426/8063_1 /TAXON_ID=265584 /ORGANISM="Stauroneis constricta, Strain CCMP1120" /LENGTH=1707 /DNA_ID=CAMNT_0007602875 /DNA_START=550 /DNA_END=5673 /DNA_ORIENTATION=+